MTTVLGTHIITDVNFMTDDFYTLSNELRLKELFETAIENNGFKIIHSNWHSFGIGLGVTGVIHLAESHASVHTWPEYQFMSLDLYMCAPKDGVIKCHDDIINDIKTLMPINTMNTQVHMRGF